MSGIEVNRRCSDDVHLIIWYDTAANSVFVRDNRTESGTFRIEGDEALNPRTFYKFNFEQLAKIKHKAGNVDLEIVAPLEKVQSN